MTLKLSKYLSIGSTMLLLSVPSFAQQPHQAIIDVAYGQGSDPEVTGERYTLKLPVRKGLFVVVSKTNFAGDQASEDDYKTKEVGGGFFWSTTETNSMYLSYTKVDLEFNTLKIKDNTQYAIGWRSRFSRQLEILAEYNSTNLDNADLTGTDYEGAKLEEAGYKLGLHYYTSPTFAVTLDWDNWLDQDRLFLGVRFTSGK
ncbi:MAG: hypothetical protein HWE27_12945 [Gammaproteobacteria bacterium]|nr:hypothetical protein [Gammaproteobacteria bacterium]